MVLSGHAGNYAARRSFMDCHSDSDGVRGSRHNGCIERLHRTPFLYSLKSGCSEHGTFRTPESCKRLYASSAAVSEVSVSLRNRSVRFVNRADRRQSVT